MNFVNAIASLIDADSELVFNALDEKQGKEKDGEPSKGHDINYRDEPVAFFFVLFGISFEALIGRSSSEEATAPSRTVEVVQSLHKILRPSVAGLAIYQEAVFSETMDILDRLVLTEGIEVQSVIVQIARNLCLSHPSARKSSRYVYAVFDNFANTSHRITGTRTMIIFPTTSISSLNSPA